MRLFMEHDPAPNPRRVRLFLAAKGAQAPQERISLRAVRAEVAVTDEESPVPRLHAWNLRRRQSLAVWTEELSARAVQAPTDPREGAVRNS